MFGVIVHAAVLAFGLILPLGVQNVFVFQQGAYQKNYLRALPVVLTAALCDTLLITLAVTGVAMLVFANQNLALVIISIGVLFLLYMGWITWRSEAKPMNRGQAPLSPKKQVLFAASVSLTNPHAILDTVGVIGTSSLQYLGSEKIVFSLVCIFVSWAWFAFLALAGRSFGKVDETGRLMVYLNKLSALIMWGVAIYLIQSQLV